MVALKTEWADPDLGSEVDPREGIENGGACLAPERRIRKRRDVGMVADRRD